jgi:UDP-N-acetylglucosamine--N-acetylmuramyl-(pentapeptide) pyrophosphoryl-undecaprenol N-acetylglucosamine transferase
MQMRPDYRNGHNGPGQHASNGAPRRRKVALAGCGTAGHVYPALAVADAYRESSSVDVIFFGTADGFEELLVPRSGHPLFEVPISRFAGQNILEKAKGLGRLAAAIAEARHTLRDRQVDLVIGFGGYGSVPTLLAARSLGIRTAIHESNTTAGRANKMLGRLVDRIYLGFEAARVDFPAARTLVIGNPVRSDVAALHAEPRVAPEPSRPLRVLVTGGSQGSPFLNRRAPELLAGLARQGLAVEVRHQTGSERRLEEVRAAYAASSTRACVMPFIDDMAAAYRWADFAISCAGAATLAELAIAGLPALLVPLASAAQNHQLGNASAFGSATGACWVTEAEWKTEGLAQTVGRLLSDSDAWIRASGRLRSIARPEAAHALAADHEPVMPA